MNVLLGSSVVSWEDATEMNYFRCKCYGPKNSNLLFPCNLQRLPSFSSSFRGPNVQAILEGCLRNLKDANKVCSSVEEKEAAVEAAHAVSVILSWPGEHHTTILELSLGKVLFRLLTEKDVLANTKTAEEPSGKHDAERRVRGTGKVTSSLWPILWEVVGHLAAHSDRQTKKASRSKNVSKAPVLDGLPGHAWCVTAY